jgi:hypothetical protein
LAPLACGVLLMLAALPPEALASANWSTGVEASLPANAGTTHQAALGLVSCTSAGNCTAIGGYEDTSRHFHALLLTETSGTWATGVEASLPANAGTNPDVSLASVSCGSAGNCTAVGSYTDSSGRGQGLLLTETSGRWATGVEAPLPANARTNPDVVLKSVSCASAGNCTAVGTYDVGASFRGLLLTETSGTWAVGVEAPLPAGVGTSPYVYLYQVSCASAGNCTAVGNVQDSVGNFNHHGLLLSETSGTWATGVESSLPANAGTNAGFANASVSCASAGNCTAVGLYGDSSGHEQGVLLSETSGTWAIGVEASLPANAGTNQGVTLFSVSCASAGNCTAVGGYTDSSGHFHGLLLTETSGTWAIGVEPSLPANADTNPDVFLNSVSCASAGNCTAVGSYTDSSGHDQGLLLSVSALALIGSPTSNGAGVTNKLICAPSSLRPCRATETLTTTETIRGGRPVVLSASARRKFRAVIVATKTVMIHPGKKVTVKVKLNATGRKLLARFGKLPVTLKITLLQNGTHLAIANKKLTVKPKKK